MEYKTIRVSVEEEGICLITMQRPEALNALSDATVTELLHAVDWINGQKPVRVVIVTGTGKAFVAGADIAYMSTLTAEQARIFSRDINALYEKINASGRIFIAAVNGYALGGGCEFALACDLRVASERASFALPEVSLGVLPGSGGTQRLPRLVGPQRAAEMIFTGATVKAAEALAMGLVCRVVSAEELMPCVFDLARSILKNSPLAVKYAKECLRQSEQTGLDAGIQFENNMFSLCFAAPDQKEGMSAFLEKRAPDFRKELE